MKNRTLGSQFRMTLVYIVISTAAASLITYIILAIAFNYDLSDGSINPSNYYEGRIPQIQQYAKEMGTDILSPFCKDTLEGLTRGDDFFYQVVDNKAEIIYGSFEGQIFSSEEDMFKKLNTTFSAEGYFIRVIGIIDNTGKIQGAVSVLYSLSLSDVNNHNLWIRGTLFIFVCSPILYLVLFSILFSKKFAKGISKPLRILTEGAKQIKNKNLDFSIDYQANNELGELCAAFMAMQKELKKSLSAQWKMEQEHVETVGALAHDMKSPLSVIKAYAETIADDTDLTEEQEQYVSVIEENIGKIINLVQQMQYTSDLSSLSVEIIKMPVNLVDFLERKKEGYILQAKEKKISVALKILNGIPGVMHIDINKVERILDNIVTNSIEYTPNGGQIEISVQCDDTYMFYSVSDTGQGFGPKDMEKAFQRFFRGDEARPSKGGHSGLGLYIVKQLSELLGGSVEIGNIKSGGAYVRFWHEYALLDEITVQAYPPDTSYRIT